MDVMETDVIVISAGTAGLAATVAAAQAGAKVITFEKASTTGGAGNMAGGPFAVESRLQRMKKIALTSEKAFNTMMEFTHWKVDARLVRAYFDKSGSTIDWLEKMGVEFTDVFCHNYSYYFTWHMIKGPGYPVHQPGAAAAMMTILTEKARELGAKIYLRTPVQKILKKGNQVTGVIAENSLGETIQANANAVIIAAGGCVDNPEMAKKYTGFEYGRNIFPSRIPGVTGDGLRMAWETGAAPTDIIMQLGADVPDVKELVEVDFTFQQPNLLVNLSGERFMNEAIIPTTSFGANPITRQKNQCAFMIFDETTKNHYYEYGLDFPPGSLVAVPLLKLTNFDEELKKALALGNNNIFVADSIDELAVKAGVNPAGLKRTLAEYNQACDCGRDTIFSKDSRYLKAIRQPKFYAARLVLIGLETFGGIKINYKTEVLNKQDEVIPGLYAAGNDANSIYSDTYPFFLPGNTLGFSLNTGRIAGENAANYVKSTNNQA
jgi:fumarate reductase flavoprotein subunit